MPEMTQGPGGVPKVLVASATHMSMRNNPEITLTSDRGGASRDGTMITQDARTTRFLLGMTLTVGGTLGLLAAVLLQLIVTIATPQQPLVTTKQPGGTVGPECREGVDSDCDGEEMCLAGQCVPTKRATKCQVGDPCDAANSTCTCGGDLRCIDHVCRAPTAPTPSATTCDDAAVATVLKGIADTCEGDLGTCDADKLEKFAVESTEFDAVMARFPNTITVHFPDKSPPLVGAGRNTWPSGQQREHYRARLAHPFVLEALAKAEDILLIGRSSEGGHALENYEYSRLRVEVVKDLLMDNVRTQGEQKALLGKIRKVLLSNRRVIEPDFFSKHFTNRLIAWSSEAEETLRANISDFGALRGRPRTWTNRIMNQVVFVVPLPCKLPQSEGVRN